MSEINVCHWLLHYSYHLRLVYEAFEHVVDDVRKTLGENVLLEEKPEEGNQEEESETYRNLSTVEDVLTNATAKKLNELFKVSE